MPHLCFFNNLLKFLSFIVHEMLTEIFGSNSHTWEHCKTRQTAKLVISLPLSYGNGSAYGGQAELYPLIVDPHIIGLALSPSLDQKFLPQGRIWR